MPYSIGTQDFNQLECRNSAILAGRSFQQFWFTIFPHMMSWLGVLLVPGFPFLCFLLFSWFIVGFLFLLNVLSALFGCKCSNHRNCSQKCLGTQNGLLEYFASILFGHHYPYSHLGPAKECAPTRNWIDVSKTYFYFSVLFMFQLVMYFVLGKKISTLLHSWDQAHVELFLHPAQLAKPPVPADTSSACGHGIPAFHNFFEIQSWCPSDTTKWSFSAFSSLLWLCI